MPHEDITSSLPGVQSCGGLKPRGTDRGEGVVGICLASGSVRLSVARRYFEMVLIAMIFLWLLRLPYRMRRIQKYSPLSLLWILHGSRLRRQWRWRWRWRRRSSLKGPVKQYICTSCLFIRRSYSSFLGDRFDALLGLGSVRPDEALLP